MLYLIYCESHNYAGYGQHFVVQADSPEQAEEIVEPAANEYFWEQDGSQLEEEGYDENEPFANIILVEEFNDSHEYYKYFQDLDQSEHYIKVNF